MALDWCCGAAVVGVAVAGASEVCLPCVDETCSVSWQDQQYAALEYYLHMRNFAGRYSDATVRL